MKKEELQERLTFLNKSIEDAVLTHNALIADKDKQVADSLNAINTLFGQRLEVLEWIKKDECQDSALIDHENI